ncbi:MAG: 30S ribosomal protein S6 [Chloroflexi bacterium]|nr:30S ribosomal protein S6 [Chloroflexota bacterium]
MAYELIYIIRPTADEQALAAVNEKVQKIITGNAGEVLKRDDWGKKRLAYPLLKFNEGFYHALQLNLPSPAVREVERSLQLTEDILRYLIVRVDQP